MLSSNKSQIFSIYNCKYTCCTDADTPGSSRTIIPERELFIWALLFNRKKLALIFWRLGQDQISGALMAR